MGSHNPRWTSAPPVSPAPPSDTDIEGTGTNIDWTSPTRCDPFMDTLLNTSSFLYVISERSSTAGSQWIRSSELSFFESDPKHPDREGQRRMRTSNRVTFRGSTPCWKMLELIIDSVRLDELNRVGLIELLWTR